MKVKIFIDGPNFYQSLTRLEEGARINYDKLAQYLIHQVDGGDLYKPLGRFAGAYYYIGLTEDVPDSVLKFLYGLEMRPGYFVIRESRVTRSVACPHCAQLYTYKVEKGVDTRLSIDMVRFAANNSFDTAILLSGDEDFVPAIQAVNDMGKQAWCATWSNELSPKLRTACFGHINLRRGLEEYQVVKEKASE